MGLFTWLNDKVTQVRQQVFGGDEGNDGNTDGSVGADQRCVAANALRALLCSCCVVCIWRKSSALCGPRQRDDGRCVLS